MSQLPQNTLIIQKQLPIRNQVKAYTILNRKDRTILSSYNEKKSLEIASLSKIVTIQVSTIIQELLELQNNFSIFVTKYAASIQGTTAELKQNDCLTLQELYYGIMLPSGNDAATTLAQNLGFLAYMNDKQNESTMTLSNQYQKNKYNKEINIFNYVTKNYKCQEIKNEEQKLKNLDKNQQSHQIYQELTLNDLLNQRNQLQKKSNQNQSKSNNNNSQQIIKVSQQNQEFDIRTYSTAQHDLGYKYFIKLMNAYVNYSLNLKQTNFQNPHGMFLNQNISNAYEQAIIASEALENKLIAEISGELQYYCKIYNDQLGERQIKWKNSNQLLELYTYGYRGIKTGINKNAQGCLSTHFVYYDKDNYKFYDLIIILLGSKDMYTRFTDTQKLIQQYFKQIGILNIQC